MAYITVLINHVRSISQWVTRHGATSTINGATFHLEIKHKNRYYEFSPQFFGQINGGFANYPAVTDSTFGFSGWRPYQNLRFEMSNSKREFKRFCRAHSISVLRDWGATTRPDADYIVKPAVGSYGLGIYGPYSSNMSINLQDLDNRPGVDLILEEFCAGQAFKACFWGSSIFYLKLFEFPAVVGDGDRSILQLVSEKIAPAGSNWDSYSDKPMVLQCLRYQGVDLETVLGKGEQAFVDFRFGRTFERQEGSLKTDSDLAKIPNTVLVQMQNAAAVFSTELMRQLSVPVFYSADGMIDENGKVVWLEINSNPVIPPEGYDLMLNDIFQTGSLPQGVPKKQSSPLTALS